MTGSQAEFRVYVEGLCPRLPEDWLVRLVNNDLDGELLEGVREALRGMRWDGRSLPLDVIILRKVLGEAESLWGVDPGRIRQWCAAQLHESLMQYYVAFLALLCTSPPGFGLGKEQADRLRPSLDYDEDGLALGAPASSASFVKEGVLAGDAFLLYSPFLREYNLKLSGGFLEQFVTMADGSGAARPGVRLGLDPDIVLPVRYHVPITTKADLRGPPEISLDLLQSSSFPEDHAGTVTEQLQADEREPFDRDVHKLQIMWSARDGLKSVQMEELVPLEAQEFSNDQVVWNRYVHARWDPESERFTHFDGAVKIYDKDRYQARLDTDPKHQHEKACKPEYRKLFRCDGGLTLPEWSNLVVGYYYGHGLAAEYLERIAE